MSDRHSSTSGGVQTGQSSHSYHSEVKLRRGAWRSMSRLQWLASNPCHKRATGRAVVTGCCRLLQDLLPTFKSAYDLGKQEREHTADIDKPEQQSETTVRTAHIPCATGVLWDFNKLPLELSVRSLFKCRVLPWGFDKGCSVKKIPVCAHRQL